VRLTAPAAGGVEVAKVFRFRRGSYLIDVSFEIANGGAASMQPYAYFQLVRDEKPLPGDSAMLPTFTGIALYTDKDKFQKVAFSDIDKGKAQFTKISEDGWVAILQHYFFSAWLPKSGVPREFFARRLEDGLYSAGVIVPVARSPRARARRLRCRFTPVRRSRRNSRRSHRASSSPSITAG